MKKSNDVKRLEEITKVILKNDLKSGISPSKVCNILAELGPTFIKIGQILSTRIDLIPKEYCAALSNLRNNTGVMPRDELEKILKEEYDDYKKVFKEYSDFIENCIVSKILANCNSSDIEEMILSFEIIILEYLLIRYALFLKYCISENEKLDIQDIKDYIVVFSRVIGNNYEAVIDFISEGFGSEILEIGYIH